MASTPQPASIEWVIRLLVYVVGVATTIVGSWVSSKIHAYHDSRKAHLEDIKSSVLVPIRKELERFEPFLFQRTPLFSVERGTTKYHDRAQATESSVEEGIFLSVAFPTGSLFRGTEPALAEDTRRNHFRELSAALHKFVLHWVEYSGEVQSWVVRMAREILERSDLPKFPNSGTDPGFPGLYVMHFELAIFVYQRLFGLPTSALHLGPLGASWVIQGGSTTLAEGPKERLRELLNQINGLLDSQRAVADGLLNQAIEVQEQFTQTSRLLDFAIAARRLRKRCDLVTFL